MNIVTIDLDKLGIAHYGKKLGVIFVTSCHSPT